VAAAQLVDKGEGGAEVKPVVRAQLDTPEGSDELQGPFGPPALL
jgi:hypothetical protein